ncbi:MAG: SDR family oxidoreductase [Candidatus Thermoplasmatota archaeon]|nr:SDR family oxidoreductase [Candidatus Thermoplasmatota archaeon]
MTGRMLTYQCDGGVGIPGLLRGRKVLVTGGSRGIGASVVRACAASSAQVGFTYIENDDAASVLVDELGDGSLRSFRSDTTDETSMRSVVKDLDGSGDIRGIHGLVCCAGIYNRRSFKELGPDDWARTMRVNLEGAYTAIRSVLPNMKRGSIVLVSSQIAFRGTRHGADYAASKAGILGLTRSLALELAPDIRVNAVSPGFIDTDLISSDTPEKRRERGKEVPLGRVGSPMEVASGVLYLLSDLSSYSTGTTLDMSGGLTMGH